MWQSTQSNAPNTRTLTEISVRIVLLLIVCIMHANLQPHIQYMTETELLYDYRRPRKDSLTPAWAMILLIIFVPILTFAVPSIMARNYADTIQALLAWSLASAITAFITETGKLIVGRPRPDFFYRCFPNEKMTIDLRCTGNLGDVIEGRKSFPSGHSSFSFCSLGFVSVWMCGKLGVLSRRRGHGIRIMTCMAPLIVASLVAMSRCCDNHHHWEDVFVGSIIGFTASYFCYRQYYHPLESEQSGTPYNVILSERQLFCMSDVDQGTSDQGRCTIDLENNIKNISDKKSYFKESNKKKA